MFIYVYLFALVVGGVLLGASILLGGKDTGAGGHAGGHDTGEGHGAHGHAAATSHDGVAGFLVSFLSLRFWTFFLAFFGLTGVLLDGLGLVGSSWLALAIAVTMGGASGLGAVKVFQRLRDDTDSAARSGDYIGKTARVLVPVSKESLGKVRLQLKGNTVDVLATTDEEGPIGSTEEVLVVELDGTTARVARMTEKERAG